MTMQSGEYGGTRVLSEATVREMLDVHETSADGDLQGYGWYEDTFDDYTGLIGHDGEDPGARSLVFFDPATGAAVLLVANGEWDEDLAEELFVALFDEAARR